MAMDAPVHVDKHSFHQVVLQSSLPVVVDFWAPWCAPCRLIAPHLDALAKELSGKIVIAKLNTDEDPELAGTYQVSGIPTLMVFKGGEVVERLVGALPKEALKQKLSRHLS